MKIDIDRESESDVAFQFGYEVLKDDKYLIFFEVVLPSPIHRSRTFRVDSLLCHKDGTAFCAVEFKRAGKTVERGRGRQIQAHDSLGIPFFYCVGRAQIEETKRKAYSMALVHQPERALMAREELH